MRRGQSVINPTIGPGHAQPQPHAAQFLRAARRLLWFVIALGMGAGCGAADPGDKGGPQATLDLISPLAPLGLHYGEQVALLLRYRQKGQAMAGVTLSLRIDGDDTGAGATLSADRVVTNDRGDASVLLTAGSAEAAFHVLGTGPLASALSIDVAVSKYAFGNLDVLVDATQVPGSVVLLRAALVTGTHCSALPPTAKLGPVLRGQQASERRAVMPFPTLLVQPYSILGRAEDAAQRLLAYGCVDLPDELLRTGLRPVVSVPLDLVFPSPLGAYKLTTKLQSKPATPPIWEQLACANGLGQVLLDALLQALPLADSELALQLAALRGSPDKGGCRTAVGTADERLNAMLAATSAGSTLGPVATDGAAMLRGFELSSRLDIYSMSNANLVGAHTLEAATLSTGTGSATYSLATLPVPSAELLLTQRSTLLSIPEHALTLRLSALWRQGLQDLVLAPRSLTTMPSELFFRAVSSAKSGAYMGCDAVEAVLCTGVATPCSGKLSGPCATAAHTAADSLSAAFTDAAPGLDFWLSLALNMEDPDGTLYAQALDTNQVSGRVATAASLLPLTGTAAGTRLPP